MSGKYFWLKLKKDFFKRHDITYLESLDRGHELVLIYLKLLCEAIDHDGNLRFSEVLPYTTKTLSAVVGADEDMLTVALKELSEIGLLETNKDGTLFLPKSLEMVGIRSSSTGAERQRRYREKHKNGESDRNVTRSDGNVTPCDGNVTPAVTNRNESKRKKQSEEKEKEKKVTRKKRAEGLSEKDLEESFKELWKQYPKRRGMQHALAAYKKARLEGVTDEEILNGINAFRSCIEREGQEFTYIPHGGTWFYQRRWNDDYSTGKGGKKKESGFHNFTERETDYDEMFPSAF